MKSERKRGRPKKPIAEFPLGPDPKNEVQQKAHSHFSEMLSSLDNVEAELVGSVRVKRPTIKNLHALGLALENELDEHQKRLLFEADAAIRIDEKKYVEDGGMESGKARKLAADLRVQFIGKKNKLLLAKIKPKGMLSVNSAAKILLNKWDELGDGGNIPSLTTARSWLKKLSSSS